MSATAFFDQQRPDLFPALLCLLSFQFPDERQVGGLMDPFNGFPRPLLLGRNSWRFPPVKFTHRAQNQSNIECATRHHERINVDSGRVLPIYGNPQGNFAANDPEIRWRFSKWKIIVICQNFYGKLFIINLFS